MRGLKATLALALALSLTTTIRGLAAEEPLMKETQGLFEPVPSAPLFRVRMADQLAIRQSIRRSAATRPSIAQPIGSHAVTRAAWKGT